MGQTREQRIINQVVGKPRVQLQTPVASDMFLPNHSGIKSHPEVKSLVGDYIKKDGTTTTTASIPFAEGLSASKNISTTKQLVSTQATGTAPLSVSSTTKVTNLNADYVDGLSVYTSGQAIPNMYVQNSWTGIQIFNGGIYTDMILETGANNYLYLNDGTGGVQLVSYGDMLIDSSPAGGAITINSFGSIPVTTNGGYLELIGTNLKLADNYGIIFGTTSGNKIGTSTSQKLSFWNATPIVQPTTGVGAATFSAVGGSNIQTNDTFDGYTLKQVVKALRNAGLLA